MIFLLPVAGLAAIYLAGRNRPTPSPATSPWDMNRHALENEYFVLSGRAVPRGIDDQPLREAIQRLRQG